MPRSRDKPRLSDASALPPPERPPGDLPPARLSDAEHAARIAHIDDMLAKAHAAGLDTDTEHTIGPEHEVWSDARDAVHETVLSDLYAAAERVPLERRAIILGGLPGSGKSTVLSQHLGADRDRYLSIDPDRFKSELADRDMLPELPGVTPMEATELGHAESSYLAKRLGMRVMADGRNLVWDITMSGPDSVPDRVAALRAAGYTRIEMVFVDIPVELSMARADSRHRDDHELWRSDVGPGGRYVPAALIRGQADTEWGSVNRRHFEQAKNLVDAWTRYDNSVAGRLATVVEAKEDPL